MNSNIVIILLAIGYFENRQVFGLHDEGLSLMSNSWKDSVEKRNTWWSKKSESPALSEDDETSNADFFTADNSIGTSIVNAVGCYIDTCVPNFLECSRLAESKPAFLRCRHAHRRCIGGCFKNSKNSFNLDNGLN